MKNILIAGGSGLVGQRLTNLLVQKGYHVAWLSRSKKTNSIVPVYTWNVHSKTVAPEAFEFADAIINLAGSGIADKRWTKKYKQEIYSSRIESTRLISKHLATHAHHVNAFISTSATGIYGNHFIETATEETAAADTFLGHVCNDWEAATRDAQAAGIRTVLIRTGIVLSENQGFIGKLKTPIKLFAGTVLGSGKQIVSWIHIDDLCNIYITALENTQMEGPYNAVAPVPASNKHLTGMIARQLHRPLLLPNTPGFVLKIVLGEMADMLIGNQPVSGRKITDAGFRFKFAQSEDAIRNLLH